MSVSDEYLTYVVDQLHGLGPVSARKMFGGAGIYLRGHMFGCLDSNDTFYMRTDDSNRQDYEAQGMGQFKPFPDKPMTMPYYEVPVDVLEDCDELKIWAAKSVAIAAKAARAKPKKKAK
jgi:DNA transformation protein and related proteins